MDNCIEGLGTIIVICDATSLERNLRQLLKLLEITPKVNICVNLIDEAEKNGIHINSDKLSKRLGIPVIGKSASAVGENVDCPLHVKDELQPLRIQYPMALEHAISFVEQVIEKIRGKAWDNRWLSLRMLDRDEAAIRRVYGRQGTEISEHPEVKNILSHAYNQLFACGIDQRYLSRQISDSLENMVKSISNDVIAYKK